MRGGGAAIAAAAESNAISIVAIPATQADEGTRPFTRFSLYDLAHLAFSKFVLRRN